MYQTLYILHFCIAIFTVLNAGFATLTWFYEYKMLKISSDLVKCHTFRFFISLPIGIDMHIYTYYIANGNEHHFSKLWCYLPLYEHSARLPSGGQAGHQIEQRFQKGLNWMDYNSFLETIVSFIPNIFLYRSNQLFSKHLIQSPVILPTRRYWTSINCSFFISLCSCFRHYSFLYFYFIFLYINSWITHFQINNWELFITFY